MPLVLMPSMDQNTVVRCFSATVVIQAPDVTRRSWPTWLDVDDELLHSTNICASDIQPGDIYTTEERITDDSFNMLQDGLRLYRFLKCLRGGPFELQSM